MGLGAIALASVNANKYPNCELDNCYRNLVDDRFKDEANVFCVDFLRGTTTAKEAIPTNFNNCENKIKDISSACSCVTYTLTHTVPVTTSASSSWTTSTTAPSTTVSTSNADKTSSSTSEVVSTSTTSSSASTPPTSEATNIYPVTEDSTKLTTSTIYTTRVETLTQCAPHAVDCSLSPVTTTQTIAVSTTVYPVTEESNKPIATNSITVPTTKMTTSTIYTTRVETITTCQPSVPDCHDQPYVTTRTIAVYTTVCPVAEESNKPTAPIPTNELTTSTIYTTRVETVTRCPPTVANCPLGPFTTT
ncbi:hypothetical protein LZ30DRAFT_590111, partial [Colletotrichum cereale]